MIRHSLGGLVGIQKSVPAGEEFTPKLPTPAKPPPMCACGKPMQIGWAMWHLGRFRHYKAFYECSEMPRKFPREFGPARRVEGPKEW